MLDAFRRKLLSVQRNIKENCEEPKSPTNSFCNRKKTHPSYPSTQKQPNLVDIETTPEAKKKKLQQLCQNLPSFKQTKPVWFSNKTSN